MESIARVIAALVIWALHLVLGGLGLYVALNVIVWLMNL